MLYFHVLLRKTSPAVGAALLCSRVLGSRSLAVSLSSRPFGTCFNQPTIHTLGLKASVVHDHCKRRRCGHRISNLLKTLDVKGSQYVTTCILPSSTNCTSSHGSPSSPTQRLAKHSVSSGLPSSPAQARHSHLKIHMRGRPHPLEFAVQSFTRIL